MPNINTAPQYLSPLQLTLLAHSESLQLRRTAAQVAKMDDDKFGKMYFSNPELMFEWIEDFSCELERARRDVELFEKALLKLRSRAMSDQPLAA